MNEIVASVTVSADALERREKWVKTRDELLERAFAISNVDSDETLGLAGEIQTKISKHIKALEVERKAVTAPLDEMKASIMRSERQLKLDLENELFRLKNENSRYVTEKVRAAEAERKRIAAEVERRNMEAAAQQEKAREMFGDDGVDVLTEAPEPMAIPTVEKPKTASNKVVERWFFEIVEPDLVPRELLSVDDAKVRAFMNYMVGVGRKPEAKGIVFQSRMCVESR